MRCRHDEFVVRLQPASGHCTSLHIYVYTRVYIYVYVPTKNHPYLHIYRALKGLRASFVLIALLSGSPSSSISACNDVDGCVPACQLSVFCVCCVLKCPLDVCFEFGFEKKKGKHLKRTLNQQSKALDQTFFKKVFKLFLQSSVLGSWPSVPR